MDDFYRLPIFETISLSWKKVSGTKASIWGAVGWVILGAIIFLGLDSLRNASFIPVIFLNALVVLKFLIHFLCFILAFGVLRVGIRIAKDETFAASMVFYTLKKLRLILKLLGFYALLSLVILPFVIIALVITFNSYNPALSEMDFKWHAFITGFIASLPLIYLLVRLRLGWGFILDKEVSSWQAMKLSFRATRRNFWRLLGIHLLNALIFIISILPLGLGLIWSLPYFCICYGVAYRKLLENNL